MREIKFRAWDRKLGKWSVPVISGNGTIYLNRDNAIADMSIKDLNEKVQVCQFTGLKDKNGKEIYEGDITNYGVIEWNDDLNWDSGGSNHPGFYFKDKYEMGDKGCLDYHTRFDSDIEVLGNIYENPELLRT
jgi:uncharacterized phage protein (TIGR01671 family)